MAPPFTPDTTAEEVIAGENLSGKNVVITGGYAGIGLETSRAFALAGAHVYIVGRDAAKGDRAVEKLTHETKNHNITSLVCDLGDFSSIRAFADKFNKLNVPIHYLILNAGVMACPYSKTKDGYEMHFGTNYLGHFLLANLLTQRVIEGAPSVVVSVTSAAHALQDIQWDDPNWERTPYNKHSAYGQSKTANILFANEFNRRNTGKGVKANSVHPGYIPESELQRHADPDDYSAESVAKIPNVERAIKYGFQPKSTKVGAASTLVAALYGDGGKFYADSHETPCEPYATDVEAGKRLWDLGAKLTGL